MCRGQGFPFSGAQVLRQKKGSPLESPKHLLKFGDASPLALQIDLRIGREANQIVTMNLDQTPLTQATH